MKINKTFKNELPQLVFKRGITVGQIITSTKCHSSIDDMDNETIDILKALESENVCTNVKPCKHALCKCCDHIGLTSVFYNTEKDRVFTINGNFNCNSKNVIYMISCLKCNKL